MRRGNGKRSSIAGETVGTGLRGAIAFVDGLIDPAVIMDRKLRPVGFNAVFTQFSAWRHRQLERAFARGVAPFEVLGCDPTQDREHALAALETGRSVHIAEVEVRNSMGSSYVMWQSFVPVKDDERVVGLIEILRDVSGEARLQERYRELLNRERTRARRLELAVAERTEQLARMTDISARDPLTGLLNRRAFWESAERALELASMQQSPSAIMMCDLDYFKTINDQHGHLVGDAVLAAAAEALCSALRDTDLVGRYGGEEFVALVTGADTERIIEVAQRCARRIRAIPMAELAADDACQTLTISIGISRHPTDGTTLDPLILRADAALYDAKRRGRNRISLYSQTMETNEIPVSRSRRPRALLVDADNARAEMCASRLDSQCDVVCCKPGNLAETQCGLLPVDFVVVRAERDSEPAFDVLERSVPAAPNACRILVLGSNDVAAAIRAGNSGLVDQVITWEDDGTELVRTIATALARGARKISTREHRGVDSATAQP